MHLRRRRVDPDEGVQAPVGDPRGAVRAEDHAVGRRPVAQAHVAGLAGGGVEPAQLAAALGGVPDPAVRGGGHIVGAGIAGHRELLQLHCRPRLRRARRGARGQGQRRGAAQAGQVCTARDEGAAGTSRGPCLLGPLGASPSSVLAHSLLPAGGPLAPAAGPPTRTPGPHPLLLTAYYRRARALVKSAGPPRPDGQAVRRRPWRGRRFPFRRRERRPRAPPRGAPPGGAVNVSRRPERHEADATLGCIRRIASGGPSRARCRSSRRRARARTAPRS